MTSKKEYIKEIEKKTGILSILKFPAFETNLMDFMKNKKMNIVFRESSLTESGVIEDLGVIYETQQSFFLVAEKFMHSYFLTIYYKPEQYNELKLFVNQLNKQYKNGTINNTTT
jgi:hypothetical protein